MLTNKLKNITVHRNHANKKHNKHKIAKGLISMSYNIDSNEKFARNVLQVIIFRYKIMF